MSSDSKLKAAGLRMALKLLPPDLLEAAPAKLEETLLNRLADVDPERHESGAGYLLVPHAQTGALRLLLVTFDEQNAVSRIVGETTMSELFHQILDGLKEL